MPRTEDLRGFITWARLRRLVLSEPQAALAQSKVALRLVDPRLRPRVLGILGTSLRVLGDLDGALRVLEVADTEARSCKDYWAAGDALQRQAAVFEYKGELERALRLASEAQAVYASLGDLRSMGRATVDRAAFLAQLDRPLGPLVVLASRLAKGAWWVPGSRGHRVLPTGPGIAGLPRVGPRLRRR